MIFKNLTKGDTIYYISLIGAPHIIKINLLSEQKEMNDGEITYLVDMNVREKFSDQIGVTSDIKTKEKWLFINKRILHLSHCDNFYTDYNTANDILQNARPYWIGYIGRVIDNMHRKKQK